MSFLKAIPQAGWVVIGIILGLIAGFLDISVVMRAAQIISEIFVNIFKAISLPVIFFSLAVSITGLSGTQAVRRLGGRVFGLALLTTFVSACIALGIYLICRPSAGSVGAGLASTTVSLGSYAESVRKLIPDNFLKPFVDGSTLSGVVIAVVIGIATLTLKSGQRKIIHRFFESFLAIFMKLIAWIVIILPLGVWAFACLFVQDIQRGHSLQSLGMYVFAIVAANLVQALIALPLLLRKYKVPVRASLRGMWPALSLAFFTKSSCAAMPMAMKCAEDHLHVAPAVSRFAFPLCTSVNMNACAAFILITFLFVAESNGVSFTLGEMMVWTVLSTFVAMGHAGVPMGCYFLASALVAQANLPLTLMGVILPFYTVLDMLESAINLWSDSCITLALNTQES